MKSQLKRCALTVKESTIHGYGVYADQDISADETIEECHFIPIKQKMSALHSYYFKIGNEFALALGFGSIYNHSDEPNAFFYFDPDKHLIIFCASKSIKKGEEIFTSYGEKWFASRNLTVKNPSWVYIKRRIKAFLPTFARFSFIAGIVLGVVSLLAKFNGGF